MRVTELLGGPSVWGRFANTKVPVYILAENLLSSSSVPTADRESSPTTNPKLSTLQQRSSCSTPLSQTNRYTKEQDYRPKATGRKTPTLPSPVPGTPFLRPVHQVPLVPHVPIVRPAHQLHPGLVQRMLAQGVHPQHLPSLLQAGEFLTWHDNVLELKKYYCIVGGFHP